jgi:hypothetical protein
MSKIPTSKGIYIYIYINKEEEEGRGEGAKCIFYSCSPLS